MERRGFLQQGVAAAAASGPFIGEVRGANDRIGVAIIGLGSRGNYELRTCAKFEDVRVVALAEVYKPLLDRALPLAPGKPDGYQDFRRVLERKDVDAVFVSTPDHWHAPAAIMACQAGKDVYCEKPLSHTIHEGRMMVKAARKYNRVMATGSQQRSAEHFQKVVEMVRSGYIGRVSAIECWNTGNAAPWGAGKPPDSDPPPGMDWDLYLGPAPKVPYNRNRHTWNYRWFWDYSGGWMTDWGAHHMDIIHWAMKVDWPETASAAGGRYGSNDNCQTPDTLSTVFQYPGFTVEYRVRIANNRYVESRSNGVTFYGANGTIVIDRASWEVYPEFDPPFTPDMDRVDAMVKTGNVAWPVGWDRNKKIEPVARCRAARQDGIRIDPPAQEAHVRNFLDCVRSRKLPVADVEIGHRSVTACHIGVIAYRLGRTVRWDGKQEVFPGDAEAQAMVTKKYREPYTLPAV